MEETLREKLVYKITLLETRIFRINEEIKTLKQQEAYVNLIDHIRTKTHYNL